MIKQPTDYVGKIKTLRKQLGLSQEDLARELGVSFATVNRWENGKTQPSKLAKKQLTLFISKQQQGTLTND